MEFGFNGSRHQAVVCIITSLGDESTGACDVTVPPPPNVLYGHCFHTVQSLSLCVVRTRHGVHACCVRRTVTALSVAGLAPKTRGAMLQSHCGLLGCPSLLGLPINL